MAMSRKLYLGFGVLILIFVITRLVISLGERVVSNALGRIVEVEEPTHAASYEMEINTTEMAQDRPGLSADRRPALPRRLRGQQGGLRAVQRPLRRAGGGYFASYHIYPAYPDFMRQGWDQTTYHERRKKDCTAVREAFDTYDRVTSP